MKTLVHVDNEQIESVLKQCSICFVGMADTDGTPYVIPMNFGYKDGSLYLHSAQEGRSISILNRNPRVCISFCPTTELAYQNVEVACSYRMRASSVICWGNVVFEEDYDLRQESRSTRYPDEAIHRPPFYLWSSGSIECQDLAGGYRRDLV